ncbi:hypothetical protein B0T18DRAFT_239215 [Schizothecium vesticola]|uniref:Uncharacterized protein n=1 Tax=Schizothecium vesticola TaxID=314040 RepID=A0AA40BPU6_9PEZI|nr:hypothetical protein B0T18DRAFT_239215 [Schizothecium vesticola]
MGRIPILYILHSVITIVINFHVSETLLLDLDPIDTHTHMQRRIRHNHCIPRSPRSEKCAHAAPHGFSQIVLVLLCSAVPVVSLGAILVRLNSIDRRQRRSPGGGAAARLDAAGGQARFRGSVIEEKATWRKRVGMKNDFSEGWNFIPTAFAEGVLVYVEFVGVGFEIWLEERVGVVLFLGVDA